MQDKPKILLLGEIEFCHESWNKIESQADVITPKSHTRAGFLEECKAGNFDGASIAFRTFASASVTGPWDQELISALPKSLVFCAHNGAGYDQIDITACTQRDPPIRVSNVPTAPDDATADAAVFLIIGALRGFNTSMLALRQRAWRGHPLPPLGHDPKGLTLGILGMGGIGRNIKRKMDVFGMTTIYHNRTKLSDELADGAEYVSFEELLARSDVLSLNLPLNPKTKHTLSTAEFNAMKPGVVLINTARGGVIDEAALVAALDSGKVRSCGLDVFENEPEIHPGLLSNPHVMLLPHMGTYTVETMTAMEEWCIDNVRSVLETARLKSPVAEQKDM